MIDRVPGLGPEAAALRQELADRRFACRAWTREHGEDHPEIREWKYDER